MSTTATPDTTPDVRKFVEHADGCPVARVETIDHGDGIVVARCCDCAAQFPGAPNTTGPFAPSADPTVHYQNEIARAERRLAEKESN